MDKRMGFSYEASASRSFNSLGRWEGSSSNSFSEIGFKGLPNRWSSVCIISLIVSADPSTPCSSSHSGITSSGCKERCAKMVLFFFAFSLASFQGPSKASVACWISPKSKDSCPPSFLKDFFSSAACTKAFPTASLFSGIGTMTPNSCLMAVAFLRITLMMNPSTGLSSQYIMVQRTSGNFCPNRSTRPSRCSCRVGFHARS